MPELVVDCPRCGSRRITFDVRAAKIIGSLHGWQNWYETFYICRHCGHATIFVLSDRVDSDYEHVHKVGILKIEGALNNYLNVENYVSLKDQATVAPPEYIPKEIEAVFKEGATCLAVGCYNAAGTMFRLCVDLATRPMLPKEDAEGLMRRFGVILDSGCRGSSQTNSFPSHLRNFHPASKRTATMAPMPGR